MNLDTGQWDPELCRLFGVPMEALPEIRPTVSSFGKIGKLAIAASICDQQAALFGHGCRRAGQAKVTFGTGAFALAVADSNIAADRAAGMTRTAAWKFGDGPIVYAIEGGVYDAASAINWARGLGLFQEYTEIDDFAAPPAIERGVVFVPALSGLAAPYWDRNAAGMWLGLGLDSSKSDMMQAMLEGIALLASEVIDSMHKATPLDGAISIDGGLSSNRYFCRFLARALGRPVAVPDSADLTALGTAQLAMIGAGLCDIDSLPPTASGHRLDPGKDVLTDVIRNRFRDAITRCKAWR
jgi:glycerol kinase